MRMVTKHAAVSNMCCRGVMDQTAELYKEDPCQCPEPTTMMPFWNEPKDKWPTRMSVTGEVRRGAVISSTVVDSLC